MAFGSGNNTEGSPSDYLFRNIVQTVADMKSADISGNAEHHYKNVIWGLQMTMKGLDMKVRERIDNDIRIAEREIEQIKETEANEATAKLKISKLQESFAKAHRSFILEAIPNIGIYKIYEEGEIDFDKISVEEMAKILHGSGGLPSAVKTGLGDKSV